MEEESSDWLSFLFILSSKTKKERIFADLAVVKGKIAWSLKSLLQLKERQEALEAAQVKAALEDSKMKTKKQELDAQAQEYQAQVEEQAAALSNLQVNLQHPIQV